MYSLAMEVFLDTWRKGGLVRGREEGRGEEGGVLKLVGIFVWDDIVVCKLFLIV